MPRVIQVIEHVDTRGKGTANDPVRRIVQYLDFDGNVLAEQHDEYVEKVVTDNIERAIKEMDWPIVVTTDYQRGCPCS